MASLPDVEEALVQIAAECLGMGHHYIPGSTAASPLAGVQCRIYRGWPKSSVLNSDLKDGTTTITIFPVAGSTRRVTKYFPEWRSAPAQTPTMSASVEGNIVTFDGRGSGFGQIAAIMTHGTPVNTLYATRVGFDDTSAGIAAILSGLIPNSSANGSSVVLPINISMSAIVVSDVLSFLETRRQEQNIWVTVWSSRPRDRDIVSSVLDDGLANLMDQYGRLTYEFGLVDGSNAQIRYISSHTDDVPQQDNLWRKDLRYMIEYPTTITEYQPVVIAVGGSLSLTDVDFTTVFGYQLP